MCHVRPSGRMTKDVSHAQEGIFMIGFRVGNEKIGQNCEGPLALSFDPFDGVGKDIAGFVLIGEFDPVGPGVQLERSDEDPA